MENKIKAEIIAHSKRESTGEEIITYKLTYPRIILSEVNTYKQIEKNTSSCLSGDTFITLYDEKRGKFFDMEIRKIFKDFINNRVDYKIVGYVESEENTGSFIVQDIKNVFSSGVKDIYKVEQNNIYEPLKVTDKHRLLTDKGWRILKDYYTEEGKYKFTDKVLAMSTDVAFYDMKTGEDNLIYHKGSINKKSNLLEELSIISVKHIGKDETYDIEVDGKYHNFIANGVVVHNSRAIPFEKMVETIKNDPFIPIAWQKPHKGMQGTEYYTVPNTIESKIKRWLEARDAAVLAAENLDIDTIEVKERVCLDYRDIVEDNYKLVKHETFNPVSKQLKNRILEPWMWVCQLVTGTRESFEHLFNQRCPQYEFEDGEMRLINGTIIPGILKGKSKKEVLVTATLNSGSPRIIEDGLSDLEWLQHNKGQAEIHFMDLAEKMYDALHESQPQILKEGQWHIPFDSEITQQLGTLDIPLEDMIKMSVAKTARISYTTIEGTKDLTLEQASEMFDKLKNSGHWSCFGHIGRCMNEEEYESWVRGKLKGYFVSPLERQTIQDNDGKSFLHGRNMDLVKPHFDPKDKGWCKNLKGFIPLRQMVEQNS